MNTPTPLRKKINKTDFIKNNLQLSCDVLEKEFINYYDELLFNECMAFIRNNQWITNLCKSYYDPAIDKYTFIQQVHNVMRQEKEKRDRQKEIYNPANLAKLIAEWRSDEREYCKVTDAHRNYYDISHPPYLQLMTKTIGDVEYHAFCICEGAIHKNASPPFCAAAHKQPKFINLGLLFTDAIASATPLEPQDLYKSLICNLYNQKLKLRKTNNNDFPFIISSVYTKIYHYRSLREAHLQTASSFPHNIAIFQYRVGGGGAALPQTPLASAVREGEVVMDRVVVVNDKNNNNDKFDIIPIEKNSNDRMIDDEAIVKKQKII
jgi:hypothetical protein